MEAKIQNKIKKKLEQNGWKVVKLIRCSVNGMPDIMAMKDGVVKFIEVKQPKGKLSEIQKYRIKELKQNGFFAEVWIDYEVNF